MTKKRRTKRRTLDKALRDTADPLSYRGGE